MPTDFSSDTFFESNDPKKNDGSWEEIAESVANRPGMVVLDGWIEKSLEVLELEFVAFTTHRSTRRNLGRS